MLALLVPHSTAQPRAPEQPGPGEVLLRALTQRAEGPWFRLQGAVEIETNEMRLTADEVEYNQETKEARASGHVHFRHFARGEELWADRAELNLAEETGRFYRVRGVTPPRVEPRPGLLVTSNPFYFEGAWAEKKKNRYILHDGFVTNCELPRPWWKLSAPVFDIIPNERAIVRRSTFRLKGVPLFYSPFFYKSLASQPRKSGFLTPNLGNSSRRGKMVGIGYYWAMHRSLDAAYRAQLFTQRGFAHHVDVRGKPTRTSDFNVYLYGVNDRGPILPGGRRGDKEGGLILSVEGRSELGGGWQARGEGNYLSSLRFRQAFTESFNEAIFSEVHSVGFVDKHGSSWGLNFLFERNENIQSIRPGDTIVIRKLPEVQFTSRERQIWSRGLPVWVSLDSRAGLVRRNQPLFQTRQFLERVHLAPRVMTALEWKGFRLLPSFSLSETHYGERFESGKVTGRNLLRSARELAIELVPPSLARVFEGPGWLGDQVKHVIEPRLSFRHASGIANFDDLIRFDETELLSNTTEAEISLIHRLYAKRRGEVQEILSWQLWQRRYFDPEFGGAVVAGRRNVVLSSATLTPFAFLDQPRHYSPVVSVLRLSPSPRFGMEWRSDYDPLRGKLVNGGLTADVRFSDYFLSLGHNFVRSSPLLTPGANQFRGLLGIGNENRRGWNAAFSAIYDVRTGVMQFATTQVTYNTECCGFSVQYRRFGFGTRNENQFRVAFSVANIGSFGTLKRQERLF
ncbi:MAG: LPS assembly protein LptD [Bryobacterales bacterium]|nr:LPS assembly protein LptD [Bryobacterales bacterium]